MKEGTHTKQKKNSVQKTVVSSVPVSSDAIMTQIDQWAMEASNESIEKISEVLMQEDIEEIRMHAQCAYDFAREEYYRPKNQKEEKEIQLARCIADKQQELWEKQEKVEKLAAAVERYGMEREIHERVMKTKEAKQQREEWKYMYLPDMASWEQTRLEDTERSIAYLQVWIQEARAMMTIPRYTHIPYDVLQELCGKEDEFECDEDDILEIDDEIDKEFGKN